MGGSTGEQRPLPAAGQVGPVREDPRKTHTMRRPAIAAAAAPLSALLAQPAVQALRDLGPLLDAQLADELPHEVVLLRRGTARRGTAARSEWGARMQCTCSDRPPQSAPPRPSGAARRCRGRTSSVQGPLTSPGRSTFCQRCRHCTSVRLRSSPAIVFQFLAPWRSTARRSASSCKGAHGRREGSAGHRGSLPHVACRPATPDSVRCRKQPSWSAVEPLPASICPWSRRRLRRQRSVRGPRRVRRRRLHRRLPAAARRRTPRRRRARRHRTAACCARAGGEPTTHARAAADAVVPTPPQEGARRADALRNEQQQAGQRAEKDCPRQRHSCFR
jgi:hypothetical protein